MKPANQLWTKTAFAKVPPIYSQDGKGDDAIAYVKVFCITNGWRYYITEYDPSTGEAFGLVQGFEVELGSFALTGDQWTDDSMQQLNDKARILPPFERDFHFKPATIGAIRAAIEADNPL